MDAEVIYALFGIIGFVVIIYYTLRATPKAVREKEKAKKKEELISEYTHKLQSELEQFKDDGLRMKQKAVLLKQFNDELSRNIFFDEDEVKEIITDLARL
jgi:hypothetical protein